jgi:RNA polymerase sigma-70 factor (ECF subfamily)
MSRNFNPSTPMPTTALKSSSLPTVSATRESITPAAPTSAMEAAHDAKLVQRFNAGDETAFVEIMERYQSKIFSIALGLLRNRADAEEIAQDTFIRAHRGLARFRGDSSLATWLHRIAVNLSRNRYWYFFRRRRHATLSLDCALGSENEATFAELIAADAPNPAQESARSEFSSLVSACMEKLDASHREILTLRNVLNRSYDEIATTLNLNVGTVKSRIARARQNLRAQLADACPEFAADAEPSEWFEPVRALGRLTMAAA